jgi:DICT domain-containing protein
LELRAALSDNSNRRAQVDEESRVDLRPAGFDRNEILDDTARQDYKRHLDLNKEELREAELNNDVGRHERLSKERQAIIEQLKAATGLSGRSRRFSNDAEKARKAVSAAINTALQTIKTHHPQLAKHLAERIQRGASCCYTGDAIAWEF